MLGLSAAGLGLWYLAWIGLCPALLWVSQQKRSLTVFFGGCLLGFIYQAVACFWFFDLHPLSWLGFTEWSSRLITLAGWLLLSAESGLLFSLLMLAYQKLHNLPGRLSGLLCISLFPFVWIFGFSMLNWTPMALPWSLLEYTQSSLWPMRWLAGFITCSGVTILLITYNVLGANVFRSSASWKKRGIIILFFPALLAVLQCFPEPQNLTARWPMPVAIIQARLPIEIIRSGALNRDLIEAAYLKPLKKAVLPSGTLLVYPEEGVVSGWVSVERPLQNPTIAKLMALAHQKQIYIAVGVSAWETQPLSRGPDNSSGAFYNAIALISPDASGLQFYYKRRLVPFGEFTPYGWGPALRQALASLGLSYEAPFSQGHQGVLLYAGKIPLGGLICFELIDSASFSGGYADQYQKRGAQLLINTSNLGWFHENPMLEAQFLSIGQMRAAESRLPLVIASNTGISAVISNQGKILARTWPNPGSGQNSGIQHKSQFIFYNKN